MVKIKKLYNLLKIMLWSCVGVFIGTTIYSCMDYKTHKELYALTSAPWYLSIQINGLVTLIAVVVIGVAMWFLKREIDKKL